MFGWRIWWIWQHCTVFTEKIALLWVYAKNSGSGSLYRACQFGHKNNIQILLDDNANENSCTKIGASSLYGACENGHVDVVQLLLNSGAMVNLAVMDGNSPLLIACQNGHHRTVQVLLNSGADVNVCNKKMYSSVWGLL